MINRINDPIKDNIVPFRRKIGEVLKGPGDPKMKWTSIRLIYMGRYKMKFTIENVWQYKHICANSLDFSNMTNHILLVTGFFT